MNPKRLFTSSKIPSLESISVLSPEEKLIAKGEVLELVPESSSILREPTQVFDFENPQIDPLKLYLDLSRTMRENGGIGLSANQVGLPYRVFVLESSYGVPIGMFNPKIVNTNGEAILDEGCLSFPDLLVKIKRGTHVRVRFAEWNGEVHTKPFEGLTARAIQHEVDHLDGITMRDRSNPIHYERALNKRSKYRKLLKQHKV